MPGHQSRFRKKVSYSPEYRMLQQCAFDILDSSCRASNAFRSLSCLGVPQLDLVSASFEGRQESQAAPSDRIRKQR